MAVYLPHHHAEFLLWDSWTLECHVGTVFTVLQYLAERRILLTLAFFLSINLGPVSLPCLLLSV